MTVGRHAAAAGADADPVVAAALARRGPAVTGPRHARDGEERRPTPVGWPGRDDDAPGGSPVGWPGSITDEPATQPAAEPAAAPESVRPRGWRRLFGGRAA
ncbi:hypothetical protein [Trujillonella humicola]|uniref:hypothetical protein n=1 Tax=Trujillonella humicola TaxID=3383699 RepID=UPI00390582BB